jgi:hypothetical protein
MTPLAIVEDFDEFENVVPGFVAGLVVAMMHQLDFQCVEKTFHRGIIPTVSLAAHRADDAVLGQPFVVGAGGILGGFKRSSQQPDEGGCDEEAEAAFGSVRAGSSAVTWPAPRSAT